MNEYFFTAGDGFAGRESLSVEEGGLIDVPEVLDRLTICVRVDGGAVSVGASLYRGADYDEEGQRANARAALSPLN